MASGERDDYALDATATCRICTKLIFLEEGPIHFECVSSKEKALTDMVLSLHCELNAMKKSFKVVTDILKTLELELNLDNMDCDSDTESETEPEVPPRSLRKTTVEKTESTKKDIAKRKTNNKKSIKGRPTTPVTSPLVFPNGTSASSQHHIVTSNKNNKTSTTACPPALPQSSNQSSSASSMPPSVINVSQPSHGITVVAPPRSIFLSRLGVEVTGPQVEKFIREKTSSTANIGVRKMLFREPREFSSFEVTIKDDEELYNIVLSPDFWPALTAVREFKHFLRAPRVYSNLQ